MPTTVPVLAAMRATHAKQVQPLSDVVSNIYAVEHRRYVAHGNEQ